MCVNLFIFIYATKQNVEVGKGLKGEQFVGIRRPAPEREKSAQREKVNMPTDSSTSHTLGASASLEGRPTWSVPTGTPSPMSVVCL